MIWLTFAVVGRAVDDPPLYSHFLVSDRIDGIHTDIETDLAPVEMGPLSITLRPTDHRIEILEHELALGGADSGLDAARLRARYRGEADLVAEIEVAGVASEIEDHLVLPEQEIELSGLVELGLQDDGIVVTTIEHPEHVEVEIESGLAEKLQLLCGGLALMAMGNLDCDTLDQLLSVVRVPLPEPGREFFVPFTELTTSERRQIEEYLQHR